VGIRQNTNYNTIDNDFKQISIPGVSLFFETNPATATAKWEAAKQRASEPPLFWAPQPRKAQHEDVVLSLPEHCHKWRELPVVEQPFTWPIE